MPIVSAPHDLVDSDLYLDLAVLFGRRVFLKIEGFNFAGSLKLRVAAAIIAAAESDGLLESDSILVESSSGNLGIALSAIAANTGRRFTCVTDSRCNLTTIRAMRALGAEVVVVDQPHEDGGLLRARLDYVRALCATDRRYVWLNQYTNAANWTAHYETTAAAIVKQFPDLDVLFCGAGTCGTVMGCARYLRDNGCRAAVVAVDAVGSVIFGRPPVPRLLPGLGSAIAPPLLDPALVDDVVHVAEADTIRACRTLSGAGYLLGASTGTVVSGALDWLAANDPDRRLLAVAISADLGERYLDTVYDDEWVGRHFDMPDVAVGGRGGPAS